jgi:hypothetical protein
VYCQRIKLLENTPRLTLPGPRSIKADPPATNRVPVPLIPWPLLDPDYEDNLTRAILLPALRIMRDCIGDRKSTDMVMGKLQASHSLQHRSQSVTDDECIFDSCVRIAERSGAAAVIEQGTQENIKNSMSPYELMVFLDEKGVPQSVSRAIQASYGVLHSEKKVLDEKKLEAAMADELLGKPIEVFDDDGKRLGFMSDTKLVVKQLALRALVPDLQPLDAEEIDFVVIEADERARLERLFEQTRSSEQGTVQALSKRAIKAEAALNNLEGHMRAAKRRCQIGGVNYTTGKENCLGDLAHRQLSATNDEAEIWVGIGLDGRVLLRQLTKSKHSNQFAGFMSIVNDGSQVQSVKQLIGWIVTIGGEKECWPALIDAMTALGELRDLGLVLEGLNAADLVKLDGKLVNGIKLKFRFTFCADGAFMFKLCKGPCGGSSRTPCPQCECVRDRHEEEFNNHYAMIKVELKKGETVREICEREGVSHETFFWMNHPQMQSEMQAKTGLGCDSVEEDHFKPWGGLFTKGTKVDKQVVYDWAVELDEPITWSGAGKRYVRGRFKWGETREMVAAVADSGWTWADFVMCVCHEPMRDLEWLLFCMWSYSRTRSVNEINAWLEARGVITRCDVVKEKIVKPVVNYGSEAKKWFAPDPLDKTKKLWESAIDYIDAGRADTKAVWASYVLLNEIMQLPYPTLEQRKSYNPRSFDHFLAFTLLYQPTDIGHYLHEIFAHGYRMIMTHLSLALHKNEAVEHGNSEHKKYEQCHGLHGGCGSDMCLDCIEKDRRKLVRLVRDASGIRCAHLEQITLDEHFANKIPHV